MQALIAAARQFASPEHLVNLLEGEWVPLFDDQGNELDGITGRIGACGIREGGEEFGADLIQMKPGSGFPLHTHPGDHLLYILLGPVVVSVGGKDFDARAGDSIFIPAELPHGVRAYPKSWGRFLAVGVPHKHVSSTDRMTVIRSEEEPDESPC